MRLLIGINYHLISQHLPPGFEFFVNPELSLKIQKHSLMEAIWDQFRYLQLDLQGWSRELLQEKIPCEIARDFLHPLKAIVHFELIVPDKFFD